MVEKGHHCATVRHHHQLLFAAAGRLAHELGLSLVFGGETGCLPLEDSLVCSNLSDMKLGVAECTPYAHLSGLGSREGSDEAPLRYDFADVIDQDMAKRAFLIAAVVIRSVYKELT